MEPRSETWRSFWAKLLRIDFFEGQWEKYRKVADARAEWLEQAFRLSTDKPILSCACGEGGIELALARRGFKVTGVDLCPEFVHFARSQAAEEGLSDAVFLTADLRDDSELPSGFGVVYCFDTFGLLGEEDEQKVLRKMTAALNPGGLLLVDCPQRDAQSRSRQWWPLRGGFLLMESRWDPKSGVIQIEPRFITEGGELVNLVDPYDRSQTEHTGVLRYLYTPEELARQFNRAGLHAQPIAHQRKGYYMLAARSGGY